jgi:DNA-binding NtrC family response regulator
MTTVLPHALSTQRFFDVTPDVVKFLCDKRTEIVLADNYDLVNDSLTLTLINRGYRVTSIRSGKQLLEHFEALYYKYMEEEQITLPILVTENNLNDGISGLTVASFVKELFPEMKVIVLTTNMSICHHPNISAVNHVLFKPVSVEELDLTIRLYLPKTAPKL